MAPFLTFYGDVTPFHLALWMYVARFLTTLERCGTVPDTLERCGTIPDTQYLPPSPCSSSCGLLSFSPPLLLFLLLLLLLLLLVLLYLLLLDAILSHPLTLAVPSPLLAAILSLPLTAAILFPSPPPPTLTSDA